MLNSTWNYAYCMKRTYLILARVCDPPCNEKHGICGTDPNKSDVLVCYCESGYTGEDCSICKKRR